MRFFQAGFLIFWRHDSKPAGFKMPKPKSNEKDQYSEAVSVARFEAALKGAMSTPHKPLKEKPKVKKAAKKAKPKK
jgi:hypothetical protein